jgi:hypothetical protein
MTSGADIAGSDADAGLIERLTTTLRTKAEQVTVTGAAFDPEGSSIDPAADIDLDGGEPRARPRLRERRVVMLAAAVVLVVGLVAAVGAVLRSASEEPAVTAGGGGGGGDRGAPAAAVADGPPVASVELPSATLELHRDGGFPVLCVRPSGRGDLHCGNGTTANMVVDGTWYLAVAQPTAQGPAPLFASGWGDPPFTGDPGMVSIDERALPAETGDDHSWAFTLVTPAEGVEFVWMQQGVQHTKVDRPD